MSDMNTSKTHSNLMTSFVAQGQNYFNSLRNELDVVAAVVVAYDVADVLDGSHHVQYDDPIGRMMEEVQQKPTEGRDVDDVQPHSSLLFGPESTEVHEMAEAVNSCSGVFVVVYD